MNLPKTPAFERFLRSAAVFGGLEGRSLQSVLTRLKVVKLPAGREVFAHGELGRTMYVVYKGEVEIRGTSTSGEEISIVKLGPGECFGEMALVELQPRSATVVSTQPVTLFSLNNLDLYQLFQEDNYAYVIVLQNICRLLSRRLRKADSRICEFLAGEKPVVRSSASKRSAARRRPVARA